MHLKISLIAIGNIVILSLGQYYNFDPYHRFLYASAQGPSGGFPFVSQELAIHNGFQQQGFSGQNQFSQFPQQNGFASAQAFSTQNGFSQPQQQFLQQNRAPPQNFSPVNRTPQQQQQQNNISPQRGGSSPNRFPPQTGVPSANRQQQNNFSPQQGGSSSSNRFPPQPGVSSPNRQRQQQQQQSAQQNSLPQKQGGSSENRVSPQRQQNSAPIRFPPTESARPTRITQNSATKRPNRKGGSQSRPVRGPSASTENVQLQRPPQRSPPQGGPSPNRGPPPNRGPQPQRGPSHGPPPPPRLSDISQSANVPPGFQFNPGWSWHERLPWPSQTGFHKPQYNTHLSFDFARPHIPEALYYQHFYKIYRELNSNFSDDNDDRDDDYNDDFDGRSVVAPGQYPHMAAIGFPTTEKLVELKCGGSLISPNFVITAAHCCELNGDTPVLVKFGIINLKDENENSEIPQTRIISEVILHPLYNTSLHYHDIALLRLQEPIVFTRFVRPIRLWALDRIPYPHVFTMGYGSTSFAKAPTNILTELDLTLVRLQECNQALPADESAPEGIVETQICAKDYVHNRDTCQGDSGGPLQLNLRRRSNRPGFRFYLVGIISYGEVCGSGSPGVYTRVSSYIDWIASIVWPEDFQNF